MSGLIVLAGLAIGLGIGAIAEVAKKNLKPQEQGDERTPAPLKLLSPLWVFDSAHIVVVTNLV